MTLILIRHSTPVIIPSQAPSEWPLSSNGIRRCHRLVELLATAKIKYLFSSPEKKAVQTAEIIAKKLDLTIQIEPGIHEHLRNPDQLPKSKQDFQVLVRQVFKFPNQIIFGQETGDQAWQRFSSALIQLMSEHSILSDQSIACVTHGTVMSLYISRLIGIEPYSFWKKMSTPAYVILDPNHKQIHEFVPSVENHTISK